MSRVLTCPGQSAMMTARRRRRVTVGDVDGLPARAQREDRRHEAEVGSPTPRRSTPHDGVELSFEELAGVYEDASISVDFAVVDRPTVASRRSPVGVHLEVALALAVFHRGLTEAVVGRVAPRSKRSRERSRRSPLRGSSEETTRPCSWRSPTVRKPKPADVRSSRAGRGSTKGPTATTSGLAAHVAIMGEVDRRELHLFSFDVLQMSSSVQSDSGKPAGARPD